MPQDRRKRARQIFVEVADLAPSVRATAVAELCGSDSALIAEVEALLRVDSSGADPAPASPSKASVETMDPSAPAPPDADTEVAMPREKPGQRIGRYKLLQPIGEGGFGSVWMAEQEKPVARKVALKIIKLGMDTRQVIARFDAERQALALMDHPNIARVLDAGATETGRPFFVMELCSGEPISDYCDRNNLSINERLELFAQVCAAVQHAHQKGIIHRDIKPSNVLVATLDGKPHSKVIDFGIAKATASKLTEMTLFTEQKQLIGTPEYMSPEQAEGSLDIDTRTDVYSLGVLLYTLLTGTTPFSSQELRQAAYGEVQRIIREVDPPKPSTRISKSATVAELATHRRIEPRRLGQTIRGELDWIVMKAIEKDRARRYETANGFAADIRRYLSGEAVVAAPPGRGYRLRKLIRRNRGVVAATAAVVAALVIGVVAFAWQAVEARGQRDKAVAAQVAEEKQRLLAQEQRKVADEQRLLAETQRKAADVQRDRAVAAEAETTKRAKDIENVSTFQRQMLAGINAQQAGQRMTADLRARYAKALEKQGLSPADQKARLAAWDAEIARINSTDAAREFIVATVLKPSVDGIQRQFADQPIVAATLYHALADVYRVLAKFDDARALQTKAIDLRLKHLGPDNPFTLLSQQNMAWMLEQQGKTAEAERLYKHIIDAYTRTYGKDSEQAILIKGLLGDLYRVHGRFAEAEPLIKEAMEGNIRVNGPANREALRLSNVYGQLLIAMEKPEAAEPYWTTCYRVGTLAFGPDDYDVIIWTNNMGGLMDRLNRLPESEKYYRTAMMSMRKIRGEESVEAMAMAHNLALAVSQLGRRDEAVVLIREALESRRRVLGPEHHDTLSSQVELGTMLRRQGKYAEAEKELRAAAAALRRTLGADDLRSIDATSTFGSLLVGLDRAAEAEDMLRDCVAAANRVLGPVHGQTLDSTVSLVNALVEIGKAEEGEKIARQVLEPMRKKLPPTSDWIPAMMTVLASTLDAQSRWVDSESTRRDIIKILGQRKGTEIDVLLAGSALANTLREQGRIDEAEPLARAAVDGIPKSDPRHTLRVGMAQLNLALILIERKKFADAQTLLVEAERMLDGSNSLWRTRRAIKGLVELYDRWDKAEPGKGHAASAAKWREKLPRPK